MGRISRSVKVFVSFFDKLNLRVKKQTFKHFEQILLTVTLIIFYVTSIKWFFCLEDAIPGCLLFQKNYIFSMPCTLWVFCLLIWRNQLKSTLFWRKIGFLKRERGLYLYARRRKNFLHALSLCVSVRAFSTLRRYFQIMSFTWVVYWYPCEKKM